MLTLTGPTHFKHTREEIEMMNLMFRGKSTMKLRIMIRGIFMLKSIRLIRGRKFLITQKGVEASRGIIITELILSRFYSQKINY